MSHTFSSQNLPNIKVLAVRLLILIAALVFSTPIRADEIITSESWARTTVPGQTNGALYLSIVSQQEASIIAVSSSIAHSASLHSMSHEDGIMKMRELDILPLPAKQVIKLNPGGNHIMLDGLKHPLKMGDSVPLILTIKFADQRIEKIRLNVPVKPLTVGHSSHEHHQDH